MKDNLLINFDWVKDDQDISFYELSDPDITWEINPIIDDNGELTDLAAIAGSSYILLSEEPDWWPFENMRIGNWVSEINY